MPPQISIGLTSLPHRILLLILALLFLAALVFVLRWCVADSAATQAINTEVAELITAWAPDDPKTHYALAALYEKSFLPGDMDRAAQEYEKAAGLSPYDYRYWLPMARAREGVGDSEGAERALRRALELAPAYAQIHWALGNVLLRQGRAEEAFAEMRLALEKNPAFASAAVTTMLQFSDEGYSAILQKLGNSPEVKAALALALVRQKNFDEGLAVWNSLTEDERKNTFKDKGEELFGILLTEKRFRQALQVKPQSEPGASKQPSIGAFSNAGFEEEVNIANTSPFDWQIADGTQPRIGVDEQQKFSGKRSLGIVFPKGSGKEFRAISQTVVVEGETSYKFDVFFRSEISTTGALRWEIADADSGALLAATEDISAKSDGWQTLAANFKTSKQTEAVTVRLVRTGCQSCSIEGRLWFDDFSFSSVKALATNYK
jgi:tetratricopeptide (TPR) repeat protein